MIKSIPKNLWSKYRHEISNEIHRRPYLELQSPLRISMINILTKNQQKNYYYLEELCKYLSIPSPSENCLSFNHLHEEKFKLKWESHREFCTFQFIVNDEIDSKELFKKSSLNEVPDLWINSLDNIVNSVNLEVTNNISNEIDIYNSFDNNYIVGSYVNDQRARIFSDFRIDGNGYHRILMINDNLTKHQLGRAVQRVLDIESYRSMVMIGLFKSKNINNTIDELTYNLLQVNNEFENNKKINLEEYYSKLNYISNKAYKLNNENKFRFQATNSYFPIINERLKELKLSTINSIQPYDTYLNSRLSPAKRTSETTEKRLNETLEQIDRTANLIQTNVELEVKNGNNLLLESMNKKTDIQIKLQKAVEGLSTVVLTYYTVGLFNYGISGISSIIDLGCDPKLISSISIIPISLYYLYNIKNKIKF